MVLKGRLQPWRPLLQWGAGIGVAGLLAFGSAFAREQAAPPGAVPLALLPAEAQGVYRAVHAGGPFFYPKDGLTFGNRERLLPAEPRGFYREYTVKTPGARDRGARRIICGGPMPKEPIACFFTGDHYASFKRIMP